MTRSNGPRYSDDERKERRRAANRKSARKSRFRENVMFFELQETVSRLKEQNEALRADNEKFRKNIVLLQSLVTGKMHQSVMETGKSASLLQCARSPLIEALHGNCSIKDVSRPQRLSETFDFTHVNPDRIFPMKGEEALDHSMYLHRALALFL